MEDANTNPSKSSSLLDKTLHELFEEQVIKTPDFIAIEYEKEYLTFKELNERANQLAHHLRQMGILPETFIGVFLDRSLEMVVALLGILKAGATYVPIDTKTPEKRLLNLYDDTKLSFLITKRTIKERLISFKGHIIYLDEVSTLNKNFTNPPINTQPKNIAFIIYTSGSSGKPKAVLLEHTSFVNRFLWVWQKYPFKLNEVCCQKSAINVVLSLSEILSPLLQGTKLVVFPDNILADFEGIITYLNRYRVTRLNVIPSFLNALLEQYPKLEELLLYTRHFEVGGESISAELINKFFHCMPNSKLINRYGSTEVHSIVWHEFDKAKNSGSQVIIGQPISNVQLYVLDNALQPIPKGSIGELYVGGLGLARGYLNEPELTKKAFLDFQFNNSFKKIYKTGDLVRYDADGNLVYIGREDRQIQIRGFRVETAEIEFVLRKLAFIRDAIVIPQEDNNNRQFLVAYIIRKESVSNIHDNQSDCHELREELSKYLPDYMIPSVFTFLEKFPLMKSGKIDYYALSAIRKFNFTGNSYVKPIHPIEKQLAKYCAHLLGIEKIGITDNFFSLSGNSLLAAQLISKIRTKYKINIGLNVVFEYPTIKELSKEIISLQNEHNSINTKIKPRRNFEEAIPLSFSQQRLWFLDALLPQKSLYNISVGFRLFGVLDIQCLQSSVDYLLVRHEILRTTFHESNGQCTQIVSPKASFCLVQKDFTEPRSENSAKSLSTIIQTEAASEFDLKNGPVIKGVLIRVNELEHVLLINMHHIVSDAWSLSLLTKELSVIYNSTKANIKPTLNTLPIQYADYSMWQNRTLSNETLEEHLTYWKSELEGIPELIELPLDKPRPIVNSYKGKRYYFKLSKQDTVQLKNLSVKQDATYFMVILAIFQVLLYRYSKQESIVVGTPIAGRNWTEVESLIGFFINTIVLRGKIQPTMNFLSLLKQLRTTVINAYKYQDLPFDRLVDHLKIQRNLNTNPLFQVALAFQNVPTATLELSGIEVDPITIDNPVAKFDLALFVHETDTVTNLYFEYATDLFEEETIARMAGHFKKLVEGIIACPSEEINALPLLTIEECKKIENWNCTEKFYSDIQMIHQLFEEQAEKLPQNIAIIFEDQKFNYEQINKRANQLAHFLRAMGVVKHTIIAIAVERSVEMIIGLLAILKSGGIYLPLDLSYPEDRLKFILEDTKTTILLTQKHLENKFKNYSNFIFSLDDDHIFKEESTQNPFPIMCPEDLAYIIYTSGSTGKPKGVENTHQGIYNRFMWTLEAYPINQDDSLLYIANVGFDISVWEMLFPIVVGGKVIVMKEGDNKDPTSIINAINKWNVSIIHFVPSLLEILLDHPSIKTCSSIKQVVCGGEGISFKLKEKFFEMWKAKLYHAYGPTEASISVTHWDCHEKINKDVVPIGRPISNTQIYLLDNEFQPVPIGVSGEIYIGGLGLARGYFNRTDLTSEKFIEAPTFLKERFGKKNSYKLYRTGDLGYYLPNGNIVFLGRIDNQVKIRGHRIELGEIESNLKNYLDVAQAVVVDRTYENSKKLLAYVVPSKRAQKRFKERKLYDSLTIFFGEETIILSEILRKHLQTSLPDYMIPAFFIFIDNIPLTTNGKIDKRSLPDPDFSTFTSTYSEPKTNLERSLCQIWSEILELEPSAVGIKNNFFDLGGNSILIIRLKSRVEKDLDIAELSISDFFKYPTIKTFCEFLTNENIKLENNFSSATNDQKQFLNHEIAIIAMSGEFSGSSNISEYWDNILNGKECLERIDQNNSDFHVPSEELNSTSYIPISGVVKDIDKFDHGFWNFSQNDATLMDPQIRKFLEHSWFALEESGYLREREEKRIGVFAGMGNSDYYDTRIKDKQDFSHLTSNWELQNLNSKDSLATRVSYLLGLKGVSLNINTACSTSLVAIVEACKSLVSGYCDMALAGGVSLFMPEHHGYMHSDGMILSKDGHCRVFDKNSTGTVKGAGVGVIVLKRLQEALTDGDNIIAIVKGYAVNNDGNRKIGFTAPSVLGQTECILEAQKVAKITSDTIQYVECHGTGTHLGDPIEIAALHDVFKVNSKTDNYDCILGGVKANIGHANNAAGIAGVIKVCKMLQNRVIPPQINFDAPNPNLHLEKTNFRIVSTKNDWTNNIYPARAGVSAFGIGGTNAHVILEEFIEQECQKKNLLDQYHILPISAKSEYSFRNYLLALSIYLNSNSEIDMSNIAYTLQCKREHYNCRNVFICKDKNDAISQLNSRNDFYKTNQVLPEIIFMFPGQGAQYPRMAMNLYQIEPVFKEYVDQCRDIIFKLTQLNIIDYLFPQHNYLKDTIWVQPALFTICFSLAKFFEHINIKANAYIGHSLGEYVAATLSNVFSLEEALKIVVKRGELMQKAPTGLMLAINAPEKEVSELLPVNLDIAAYNAQEFLVVSGKEQDIRTFKALLDRLKITNTLLHTSHAFHSRMMEPIVEEFKTFLKSISFNRPNKRFISNITGNFISPDEAISPDYWAKHIRLPVLFSRGIIELQKHYKNAIYLEIGPGNILSSFVAQHGKHGMPYCINTLPNAKDFQNDINNEQAYISKAIGLLWCHGYDIKWQKIQKTNIKHLRCHNLPPYQFEKKSCWIENSVKENKILKQVEPNSWVSQPTWLRIEKISHPKKIELNNDYWLIFKDKAGMLDSFISYLRLNNHHVTIVEYSELISDIVINENRIVINPYMESHYMSLCKYLLNQNFKLKNIVHGWNLARESDILEISFCQYLGFYSLYFLQTMVLQDLKSEVKLIIVMNGINQVTGKDTIQAEKGSLLGAARSIVHEILKLKLCFIDISFDEKINSEFLFSLIKKEESYKLEPNFSIRFGYLWKEVYEPIYFNKEEGYPLIGNGDVILISGGLGGVALSVAKRISREYRVKFILASRTSLDNMGTERYKKHQLDSLEFIRMNACEIELYQCDITNLLGVNELICHINKKYKKIDGVIHAVGVMPLNESERTLENMNSAIKGKLVGAQNLLQSLKNHSLKFFGMTSSLASIMGDIGRVEYCAANSYLDVLSGMKMNNIEHVVSINWLGWSDVGLAIKNEKESSQEHHFKSNDIATSLVKQNFITEKEGAEIFYKLINQKKYNQILVSKFDIPEMKKRMFDEEVANLFSNDVNNVSNNILTENDATDQEKIIGNIFFQILGNKNFSKHNHYFELGGNSLSAIKLANKLSRELNVNLNVSLLLKLGTVAKISEHVEVLLNEKLETPSLVLSSGEI